MYINKMFKLIVLFASFCGALSQQGFLRGNFLNRLDDWTEFGKFQEKFIKKYESLEDFEHRFGIFRSNLKNILLHNLDSTQNFTMSVNAYTDLSPAEFKERFTGGFSAVKKTSSCAVYKPSGSSVPGALDWRAKGGVTSVKNQGQCGSCWSFSSSGAMEGAWAIKTGELISLSEQQLVDCSKKYGNMACKGGLMDSAFEYAIDTGMCADEAYPYTSGVTKEASSCHSCSSVATFSSCADVPANNQVDLKAAVAFGPVSIAIEADTSVFQSYSSGVITSSKCGTNLDHGVLIVGYGEESGIKYWLVKNSWGTSWGDQGYVKIERSDSTNDAGICGIAMQPSFPLV